MRLKVTAEISRGVLLTSLLLTGVVLERWVVFSSLITTLTDLADTSEVETVRVVEIIGSGGKVFSDTLV